MGEKEAKKKRSSSSSSSVGKKKSSKKEKKETVEQSDEEMVDNDMSIEETEAMEGESEEEVSTIEENNEVEEGEDDKKAREERQKKLEKGKDALPKSFLKMEGEPIANFQDIMDDDVELWYITAPANFDPMSLNTTDLIENSDSGFDVELSSTATSNSTIDYVLIEDKLQAKQTKSKTEISPLSLTAMNLFPVSSSSSDSPTFTLGKPFHKRLRVVERLGGDAGGQVVKKAREAKKEFVEPPPNVHPPILKVRYHPIGCDGSPLPGLVDSVGVNEEKEREKKEEMKRQRESLLGAGGFLEKKKQAEEEREREEAKRKKEKKEKREREKKKKEKKEKKGDETKGTRKRKRDTDEEGGERKKPKK